MAVCWARERWRTQGTRAFAGVCSHSSPQSAARLRGLCQGATGPQDDGVQVTSLLQMLFSRLRVLFPLVLLPRVQVPLQNKRHVEKSSKGC